MIRFAVYGKPKPQDSVRGRRPPAHPPFGSPSRAEVAVLDGANGAPRNICF
jgi:hypothetical protein